jgi:hypothetical protein
MEAKVEGLHGRMYHYAYARDRRVEGNQFGRNGRWAENLTAGRDALACLKFQADVAEGLRKSLSATALYISGKVVE